jgi:hypothetical protein
MFSQKSRKVCHPDRSEAEWSDLVFQLHLGDARPRRSRDSALDKGYVESAEDLCGWSSVPGIKRQK